MQKPPAFQFYAKDWIAGTAHLTLEQQGAYVRLLSHEWEDGPLPGDPGLLARILGIERATFDRIWVELEQHFHRRKSGAFVNRRLEEERRKQQIYRQRQAENGRRGGRPAKGKPLEKERVAFHERVAFAKRKPTESSSSSSSSSGDTNPPTPLRAQARTPTANAPRLGRMVRIGEVLPDIVARLTS